MTAAAGQRSEQGFIERAKRAARLESSLYEEVEHDPGAGWQALAVVLIAALASAIATGIDNAGEEGGRLGGFVGGAIISGIVGWMLWTVIALVVGRFLGGTATFGEVARGLGFTHVPGWLAIFGFLPLLGVIVATVIWFWQTIAAVVAIRAVMDFSWPRALGTVIIGALIRWIVLGIWSVLTWIF